MAVMTFELEDGFKSGDITHTEVGLRELTPKDVFEAQLASEKIGMINNRPYAYTSDIQMGMELLCRQVDYIGEIQGPVSIKVLLKLSSKDFDLLQIKSRELDNVIFPNEVMEDLEVRGRD
ncbi:phage tail assembly protein [Vibrio mytili]|uniref:phage tail assembly protein n=1 Tax=Vibrio mytili TaxID=50718 RepID=UPI002F3F756E